MGLLTDKLASKSESGDKAGGLIERILKRKKERDVLKNQAGKAADKAGSKYSE